jgi:D-inositol-3-phosphate glycosyltransferase
MEIEHTTPHKIVLVGPAYPFRGGIAQYLAILYRKLKERGHQIEFISFKKQFPQLLFPGATQLESSQQRIEVNSIQIFKPLNPWSWWKSARIIRKFQPNIIIFKWWMPFFGPGFGTVIRWAMRGTNAKALFIVDNAIPHEPRIGDKWLTHYAFKPVQYFIAQSETVQKDMLSLRPDLDVNRLKLVPHPIYDCYDSGRWTKDKARKELGISESRVLLFFGYIRRYKGLRTLIQALPLIRSQFGDDFRLIIVGEFYEGREEIISLMHELLIVDRVLLVDKYVPNEDVEVYFRAVDVAILPYESATQSGIIQIAYSFNLPVITTNVGGLPEVVKEGETGFLVPPSDPNALSDAIIRYFDEGWRGRLSAAIHEEREQYSWEPLIEAIEKAAVPGWK